MPITLIAVDLDGTLLSHDGRVGERNTSALSEITAAGVPTVIATGRRHHYAMGVLRPLFLKGETVLISSNGAVVRTVGDARLLRRTPLNLFIAKHLCAALKDFRDALVITFDRVGADGEDGYGALVVEDLVNLHSSIGRWMEVNAPYIERVTPIEKALDGDAPIQMMLCGSIERMRLAESLLLQNEPLSGQISMHRTEYPDRDLSLLDILPQGCSKGEALCKLLQEKGLRTEDMMAIGDNWNDLPMLEVAGWPVLMGNAPNELKDLAVARGWRIAPRHDQDGVAVILEEVLSMDVTADKR